MTLFSYNHKLRYLAVFLLIFTFLALPHKADAQGSQTFGGNSGTSPSLPPTSSNNPQQFFVPGGGAGPAPAIADSPCDPTYFDSLEARAWLEAQREITQNQNLIFKADSVLEYTCFDKFANVLATQALSLFSETTKWGTILKDDSMDNALQALVGAAVTDYLDSNFNHNFLGEKWTYITPEPTGDTDYASQAITGGSYSCDVMARVWAQAKCMDFIEYPAEDGFFTFTQYGEDEDKRYLPSRCNKEVRWNSMLPTALTAPPWKDDKVKTYLDKLDPSNCGKAAYQPIETGVTVKRSQGTVTDYKEKVCIQPGCYYEPSGLNTGACKPKP